METMRKCSVFLVLVFLLAIFISGCDSITLSTKKRWIIDDATGDRVKLACTHWVAHAEPMLAEGLNKLPVNDIVTNLTNAGFNCVRFSYATYMFTRYANRSVSETLYSLDIPEIVSGIVKHNPTFLNMTHLEAYETVVDALGEKGVMVIIDNHVSLAEWCCDNGDQNGFFGDRHFNPNEWMQGLASVANHFKGKSNVVAMDLRNELRGKRQNVKDWFKYMSQGAKTIHEHNPKLLVVISGLNFDNDLSFLRRKSLDLNFKNKLVYESHIYSFSGSQGSWNSEPVNGVCASVLGSLRWQSGFLLSDENPAPLWVSEFGYDMSGKNSADNKYMACLASFLASVDLDWSLWAFGGSYYIRRGSVGPSESYGVMDFDWKKFRDPKFPEKFQLLQRLVQDPSSKLAKSHILFHPLSGNCGHGNNTSNELELGDCVSNSRWSFEGDGSPIRLINTALCLKAAGEGLPPTLSEDCLSPQSAWKVVSVSRLHLATFDNFGKLLCLERDSNSSKIVTRKCICLEDDDPLCLENPQNQWFQLISTNV